MHLHTCILAAASACSVLPAQSLILLSEGDRPLDHSFTALGEHLVFAAETSDPSVRNWWISDGSASGTRLLPTNETFTSGVSYTWRGRAYYEDGHDVYAVSADPTDPGFVAASFSSNRFVEEISSLGDRLILRDGSRIYATPGTPNGGLEILANTDLASLDSARVGNQLFFLGFEPDTGTELWVTDGTTANTRLVRDIRPGPDRTIFRYLVAMGDEVYFQVHLTSLDPFGSTPVDWRFWRSDGTLSGTYEISAMDQVTEMTLWNDALWFIQHGPNGADIWTSDGTAAGTQPMVFGVGSVTSGVRPTLIAAGDRLFFEIDADLWVSDGTQSGTTLLASDIFYDAFNLVPMLIYPVGAGTRIFFNGVSAEGIEPWTSDGTVAGTMPVANLAPANTSSLPQAFTPAGDQIFFSAQPTNPGTRELWAFDADELDLPVIAPLGRPCTGSAGAPRIQAQGTPRPGSMMTFELEGALSGAPVAMLLGFGLLDADRTACGPLIAPPLVDLAMFADASGQANLPLTIPFDSALIDLDLFARWLILDAGGELFATYALSEVLRANIGG